jgi:hypothetical protein
MEDSPVTRIAVLACALAALLVVPGTALAAPPANDNLADAFELFYDVPDGVSNVEATTEADLGGGAPEPTTCDGATTGKTVWWFIRGSGRSVQISTAGSSFDTTLCVWRDDTGAFVAGNNNADATTQSRVNFGSQQGVFYLIQVGGAGGASGNVNLTATTTRPSNDNRASAQTITHGVTVSGDDFGALVEGGEDVFCEEDSAAIDSTVWYRWTAPEDGEADFLTGGGFLDTVLQLFEGSSSSPVRCNDDVGAGNVSSKITRTVTAGTTYLIQVGSLDIRQERFTVRIDFREDFDRDNDGHNRPGDCDDRNASVFPGAAEVPGNGVDDDCRDGDEQSITPPPPPPPPPDGDGDGVPDASDACPNFNARGGDRNGNGCLDRSVLARGTPVLRALPTGSGVRIVGLRVDGTARGSRVSAQCSRRRACPRQSVNSRGGRVTLRRFRSIRLPAGVTLEIRITRPDAHGRLIRYRIVRGNFRRSEMGIPVGSRRPARRCGSSRGKDAAFPPPARAERGRAVLCSRKRSGAARGRD